MRELFEELVQEGEKGIDKLLLERRQESVDLEFKEKTDASNGEPGRDDRRNLAKILSAFSNSMGGLVVWGVKQGKTPIKSIALPIVSQFCKLRGSDQM